MENIKINLTSWSVDEATNEMIIALWNNCPQITMKQMAFELGVSDRTLYRKIRQLGLNDASRSKRTLRKIKELESLGFTVTQN